MSPAASAIQCPSQPDGCLGCSYLETRGAQVVTLVSGQEVCSWCPSWRDETKVRQEEAYAILRMADRETRREHLAKLERRHGAEYRRRLEAVVMETWERRRAAVATPEAASA